MCLRLFFFFLNFLVLLLIFEIVLETSSTLEYSERLCYIPLAFLEVCFCNLHSVRVKASAKILMESMDWGLPSWLESTRDVSSVFYTLLGILTFTHDMKFLFVPFILLVEKWRSMVSLPRSCDWCLIFKFQNESCAEATEGCGFDLKMFFRKFCWQGKSFNPASQMVLELYNTLFRGAIHPLLYARRVT